MGFIVATSHCGGGEYEWCGGARRHPSCDKKNRAGCAGPWGSVDEVVFFPVASKEAPGEGGGGKKDVAGHGPPEGNNTIA